MVAPTPRVVVILVNYQDYATQHLGACYQSLLGQIYPRERWALFVVDNDSTAITRRAIAQRAPRARILEVGENLGWAGGNNAGIRTALQEVCEFVVALNMDTTVDPSWLERLVEYAEAHPHLHILQSKILLHGTGCINSLGGKIQFLGYGYCLRYAYEDAPLPDHDPIDFASGASMLVRREVFERIGLFRDEYFMYGEDLEFCWRARLAGFHIGVADKSICHHRYDFTKIQRALFYVERNRLTTMLTLPRLGTILLLLPGLILFQCGALLYFTFRGWGRTAWALIGHFLRPATWWRISRRRRELASRRVIRDAEIVRGFSGIIVFAEIRSRVFRYLINPLLWLYWTMVRWLIVW